MLNKKPDLLLYNYELVAKGKRLVIRMPEEGTKILEDNRDIVVRMLTPVRKKYTTVLYTHVQQK